MAVLQNKSTLLVLLFLLCFFSFHIQARARLLKEKSNQQTIAEVSTTQHNKEAHVDQFKPKEEEEVNGGAEVFSMDYSPASRKPPIHN
ncbi:uncharacterized protein LOC130732049 [Lotus japonicus]|uniref:uncharacterized protein LOC130732049 n=1 Tax=Lotus japonicus TaxID=34305 RepID=UPI00258DF209|nr:uncharacterized protein LOC130732049 [Lotus japonicus]